jgi:diguanylate cyclase (GGDEF)-like protein
VKSAGGTLPFSQHEFRRFILPVNVVAIGILVLLLLDSLLVEQPVNFFLGFLAVAGILYIINFDRVMRSSLHYRVYSRWINPVLGGIGIGAIPYLLPERLNEFFLILSMLSIMGIAISTGRLSAYINMVVILVVSLGHFVSAPHPGTDPLYYLTPFVICSVLVEAVSRIEDTTQQHIHRLETINKVSRQIMMSLDTEQTISLLNATIQDALEADTYYVGIEKDGDVHLDLFYDDGEYFNGTSIPIEGTLTGWVIRNQKELFLPDLREDVKLEGVGNFIIGRQKQSLSWMGVPLKAVNVTGVIALASYKPNAFDAADMELLLNLAQHITLALDNTIRHSLVEEQARLDSMTGVYNHAYFLEKFTEQAKEALQTNRSLSLIMLDIDYFKQFNDTYGHLVGDKILNTLCLAIKQHIKRNDAVGRWGGEEFIISLAGATGKQAIQVAKRIGETMSTLHVEDREGETLPVPTVSQGIAVFPAEADEIYVVDRPCRSQAVRG